ncbi:hypothetical protein DAI22_03g352300 [Oryza sativa Japonica Group]|nr:hypothetical protein DAI22_03g352300 [Oryza sativa Japonica Group]
MRATKRSVVIDPSSALSQPGAGHVRIYAPTPLAHDARAHAARHAGPRCPARGAPPAPHDCPPGPFPCRPAQPIPRARAHQTDHPDGESRGVSRARAASSRTIALAESRGFGQFPRTFARRRAESRSCPPLRGPEAGRGGGRRNLGAASRHARLNVAQMRSGGED